MAATIGQLLVSLKASGVQQATKLVAGFQKGFGLMSKKVAPQLEMLKENFAQFGAVATLVLIKLIQASPRLRAQFEVLNIRTNELLRTFGDSLVPIIKTLTDVIVTLTDFWKDLDPVIQDSIIVGFQFVAVIAAIALALVGLIVLGNPIIRFLIALGVAAANLNFIWETNFLGIREATERVVTALAPLFERFMGLFDFAKDKITGFVDVVQPLLGGFFLLVSAGILAVTNTLVDWIDAIEGVFKAFEGLGGIAEILTTIKNAIALVVIDILDELNPIITWFTDFMDFLTGEGLQTALQDAGKELMKAFLDGIKAALDLAGDLVKAGLSAISPYFGGSLPEKGPLQHIDIMGEDLGKFYLEGINRGLQNNSTSNIFNRNFNIQRIDMNVGGADLRSVESFRSRMDTNIRKSTVY